jgi:hypothetical protein
VCPAPAGLISAAPGKRNTSLQNSSRQVEMMVRQKMEQKEYIILCLEDSNDWSNATTRRLVMQVRIMIMQEHFTQQTPAIHHQTMHARLSGLLDV